MTAKYVSFKGRAVITYGCMVLAITNRNVIFGDMGD